MSERSTDIHVDHRDMMMPSISIYDRFGRAGDISLTIEEAEYVRDQLDEILEDENEKYND